MKALRLFAAIMFLVSAVLHFYVVFGDPSDPLFLTLLISGIIQLIVGVLLMMKIGFARWLGLLPLVGLILAPVMLDFSALDWTFSMFFIENIAAICCLILIIKKSKG